MEFTNVKSYENIETRIDTYTGFITKTDIKKAIELGKKFFKHGFYCRDMETNINNMMTPQYSNTQFYAAYRIPATNIIVSLQIIPISKNKCVLIGCSSGYLGNTNYEPKDDFDKTDNLFYGDLCRNRINERGEFLYRECDNETDLRNALIHWADYVTNIIQTYKKAIEREQKDLTELAENSNMIKDFVVSDNKYKLSDNKNYVIKGE